jgi:hypothetical protein
MCRREACDQPTLGVECLGGLVRQIRVQFHTHGRSMQGMEALQKRRCATALTLAGVPRRRIQPYVFPNPPSDLSPNSEPVIGITTALIVMPCPRQGGRIGTLSIQGHQVIGVTNDLLLTYLALAPPGPHLSCSAGQRGVPRNS